MLCSALKLSSELTTYTTTKFHLTKMIKMINIKYTTLFNGGLL